MTTQFVELIDEGLTVLGYAEIDEGATLQEVKAQVEAAFPMRKLKRAVDVDARVKNYVRLGLTEEQAKSAVAGGSDTSVIRITAGGDGSNAVEDRRAKNYRRLGLSESQAREAARVGHPSGSSLTNVAETEEARKNRPSWAAKSVKPSKPARSTSTGGLKDIKEPARKEGK